MHVVHGGNEQAVAIIYHLGIGNGKMRRIARHTHHTAIFYRHTATLQHVETARMLRVNNVCFIDFHVRLCLVLMQI